MNTNPTLQDRAVEAAARFLEVRGYETLATGWKSPETRGTIDLVARDPESDDLVFVDVSARPNSGAGFGDGRNDRETMELLAVSWLVENDFAESVGVRFDQDQHDCRRRGPRAAQAPHQRLRRGLGPPARLGQAPSGRRGPFAGGSPHGEPPPHGERSVLTERFRSVYSG